MSDDTDTAAAQPARARMSMGRVVEMLLAKREHGTSSVTLSRNAKGDTQIEVVVRTADEGDITTPQEAETVAQLVYERLRNRYPMRDGTTGGPVVTPTGGTSSEAVVS